MEALGDILKTSNLAPQLAKRLEVSSGILNLWCDILPRYLADACTPVMLANGVLTVETLSPSYSFDLRCESLNILARLREHLGINVRRLNIILKVPG